MILPILLVAWRKRPAIVVTAACLLAMSLASTTAWSATDVPKPKPNPARQSAAPEFGRVAQVARPKPVVLPRAEPVQILPAYNLSEAKACEAELGKLGVRFKVVGEINGDGLCGVPRAVTVTQIGRKVRVTGSPKLNCDTALAMAKWIKHIVAPVSKVFLDADLTTVQISTSYQCRRRNNARTGKLSEHAFGNGIDVMGFKFEKNKPLRVALRDADGGDARAFQAAVRGGACAYFTTVLGPGTNAAHADHFHLDLAVRRGGYRLCE